MDPSGLSRARALANVLASSAQRRLLLAYVLFNIAEFAVWIAMLVYAFRQGGINEASLVAVVQLVPASIVAATVGTIATRYGIARTLTLGYALQAGAMAICAAAIAADLKYVAYAAAAGAACAVTFTRPCQAAIAPSMVRGAEGLTAMNVVNSWIESGAMLAGPAIAGALLSVGGVDGVFGAMAACAFVATLLTFRFPEPQEYAAARNDNGLRALVSGLAAAVRLRDARPVVGMIALGAIVIGSLDVLYVVFAEQRLHLGQGGAGFLNSTFGAGSVLGGIVVVSLIGRRHLFPALALAALSLGVAFAAMGASHSTAAIVGLLGVCGISRTLLDTAARTLLQRVSTLDVVGHVFAALESITMASLAFGSFVIPFFVAAAGSTWAPVGVGVIVLVAFGITAASLRRVDRDARGTLTEVALLRRLPLFHVLGSPALETLAREGRWIDVDAGTVVIREGDPGDLYYVIAEGSFAFSSAGSPLRALTVDEGFGEIALIHDVPRTATAVASEPSRLFAIAREPFLLAVTGSSVAYQYVQAVARERLEHGGGADREVEPGLARG